MLSFEDDPHLSHRPWKNVMSLVELVIESIPAGTCVFDSEGKLFLLNKQFETIVDKSRQELVGKTIFNNSDLQALGLNSIFNNIYQRRDGNNYNSVTLQGLKHRLNGYLMDIVHVVFGII